MFVKTPRTIVPVAALIYIGLFLIGSIGCSSKKEQGKNAVTILPTDFPRAGTEAVTASELKEIVEYLASDRLQGRFSGSPGAGKAADFIAGELSDYGLESVEAYAPSFFQPFSMRKKRLRECSITTRHGRIDNWTGFGERFSNFYGEVDTEIVFAGYGREQDLASLDVEDRVVAFFTGEPGNHEGSPEHELVKMRMVQERGARGHMLIYHDEEAADRYILYRKVYYGDFRYYLDPGYDKALQARRAMTVLPSAMAELLGISADELLSTKIELDRGVSVSERYQAAARLKTLYTDGERLSGANVLGCIQGRQFPGRWILLSAHYDHLGTHTGNIYNGADDNASGVAALLETAESFSLAVKSGWQPEHSILFLFTDAEEIGANGSRFFIDSGIVPSDSIIIDLNVDAIGRREPASPVSENYVYLYRSDSLSDSVFSLFERMTKEMSESINVTSKATPPGSDNFIFEMNGVPAAALTTGRSSDYHKPSDTADKCDYDNISRITAYIFSVVWQLAMQ